MSKLEKLHKLGYIDTETKSRSEELLNKVESDFNKKADELEKRIDFLLSYNPIL